jgi:hypothetical protein
MKATFAIFCELEITCRSTYFSCGEIIIFFLFSIEPRIFMKNEKKNARKEKKILKIKQQKITSAIEEVNR